MHRSEPITTKLCAAWKTLVGGAVVGEPIALPKIVPACCQRRDEPEASTWTYGQVNFGLMFALLEKTDYSRFLVLDKGGGSLALVC